MLLKFSCAKLPKISLIITYYNLGNYLQDCVDSILSQSYQNFEIIIVNDCSDEKNFKIFDEISHEKIIKISLEQNSGQLLSFCKGLELANGEFVCMIDADDVLLPNYLETLLYIHLNNKVALVSSEFGEINQNNEIVLLQQNIKNIIKYQEIEQLYNPEKEFSLVKNNLPYGLWGWNPSTSAMFRKSSLEILKYFPNKDFWMTGADKVIFSLLHLIGGSINTDAILYLYRHHNENNSQTTLTTGNKKYLSENYVQKLIKWNVKLRFDTFVMFLKNKKELVKIFNKLNYNKMLFKVMFCINAKICAKVIKTIAHKLF